ncbi:MerR family transcriptional regulator [Gulosibacter sp. ACHW.36C]|uniref:MerR family transcriptional regulator n=1 Tax=Gulosibacter sediminis TaxID=1729695 RepID=A0ABY4MX79_9MICO|nr:MerR family transcriptional regulator [Gulosibacter sediminis]UQN15032.1 MerR family transcriptional regulator [Gulosibacter sediminis]
MEWSTHEVVAATGVTSRTLRHYGQIGLLPPDRVGHGGLRYYAQPSLVRLQRILGLRDLGVDLASIREILDGERDDVAALRELRERLTSERARIRRQIAAIDATITAIDEKEDIMPKDMFDGFDHTQYDAEVRERWGDEAADRSNSWWAGLGESGQAEFRAELEALNDAWDARITAGDEPGSAAAQQVAAQHVAWLRRAWQGQPLTADALRGLATMYADDPRFAANYTRASEHGAEFVRDALLVYADAAL